MYTPNSTEQDMYIQFVGSWIIDSHTKQARQALNELPALTAMQSAKVARSGRAFAQWLRANKLGQRVSNLGNMLPELRAIATNY